MKRILKVLFVIYVVILLYLLFFRGEDYLIEGYTTVNLRLFDTIRRYLGVLRGEERLIGIVNLLGNVLVFVPFGILFPSIYRKLDHLGIIIILSVLIPSSVEAAQYLTKTGIADIDDILLNAIGIITGFLIYKIISIGVKKDAA